MGKVLKHNVMLRRNPPAGEVSSFKAGDTLPDWAEDRVGEHLFEDARGEVEPKEVERKLPEPPAVKPEAEKELEVPSRKKSVATWRKFAKEAGVELPAKANREEIIEKVVEKHPDLEIPED